MPGFVITNAGLSVFTAASLGGPKVDISMFRVGSGFNYTPTPLDTDIQTPITGYGIADPQGYMPIVNYQVIDANTVSYTLRMDNTIGTFNWGEVGLYQETSPGVYACVALYAFSTLQQKQAVTLSDDGNYIEITARLGLSNVANLTITTNIISPTPANILEINSPDQLPVPATAPVNTYIINGSGSPYGKDNEGNAIIAYRNENDYWTFSTHLHELYSGVVATSTLTQLTDGGLGTILLSGFQLGKYIVQFTSGAHKGECRLVTSSALNTIDWFTSTGTPVPVGTTYVVYIANVSYSGGSGGGGNAYKLVVVSAPAGQTVFNTFPVVAEQAIVYFGGAYQPPSDYVLNLSDPHELTFTSPVPVGTRVHFMQRTLDYSTVIPGGSAGQVLVKNTGANGDYGWTTLPASGQNAYLRVTATNSGDGNQYIFNIAPLYADNSMVFVGTGFQPPYDSLSGQGAYNVTGLHEITFTVGSGVPAGSVVHFMERAATYLGTIPGGAAGQVLTKISSTDGDYVWQTPTYPNPVPSPVLADKGKVLKATGAGTYAWELHPSGLVSVYTKTSTGSSTTTIPSGYDDNDTVIFRLWGSGGSGAVVKNTGGANDAWAGGGGGGGFIEYAVRYGDLSLAANAYTVVVGVGGAALTQAGNGTQQGLAGGSTVVTGPGLPVTMGIRATGGLGGNGAQGGGVKPAPGGGPQVGSKSANNGSPGNLGEITTQSVFHGGFGGSASEITGGGGSMYGGGGGGAARGTTEGGGGGSIYGGNGGQGNINTSSLPSACNGVAPGGGGGGGLAGTAGTAYSGAGANGRAEIWIARGYVRALGSLY